MTGNDQGGKGGTSHARRALSAVAKLLIALVVLAGLVAITPESDLGAGAYSGPATVAKSEGTPSGEMTISTWPFYIDKKTIPNFEAETGVSVDYIEDVNDNNEFFSKLQPYLKDGQAGGRSIMVVTSWMAKKMHDLGYLQTFDKSAIPNFEKNLIPSLQHPSIDPNRDYSAPWQSGLTGLVVNSEQAPDVTSVNDLFDPKYKGRVTVLSEMRDTVPLLLLADGIDPSKATTDEWLAAIEKLNDAVDSGQLRDFTGNDYVDGMARGDVVAAIGWSGDAIQLQSDNPAIEFRMPDEGCVQWADEMVIPVGAPNPTAANAWIDYVYDPVNQAPIANYNFYVTPVSGVQEIFEKSNPEAAKSPLIFPSEEYTKNCVSQPNPPDDGINEVNLAFQDLVTGG